MNTTPNTGRIFKVAAKQHGRWVTLSRDYAHEDDAADYAAEHTTVTGEACKVFPVLADPFSRVRS